MDSADDEFIQRICTGVHVFFCCLGTTKSAAGSAVSWWASFKHAIMNLFHVHTCTCNYYGKEYCMFILIVLLWILLSI